MLSRRYQFGLPAYTDASCPSRLGQEPSPSGLYSVGWRNSVRMYLRCFRRQKVGLLLLGSLLSQALLNSANALAENAPQALQPGSAAVKCGFLLLC